MSVTNDILIMFQLDFVRKEKLIEKLDFPIDRSFVWTFKESSINLRIIGRFHQRQKRDSG